MRSSSTVKRSRPFALTKAWADYDGPEELAPFADFLSAIGEVVISFSLLEARMRWCKEALLEASLDEAYELEGYVQNFSARCKFLEISGLAVARNTNTIDAFRNIVANLTASNTFRNKLLHNKFCGIKIGGLAEGSPLSIMKEKFDKKPHKRPYSLSLKELRGGAQSNQRICKDIQAWTLQVRPDAQNRAP